MSVKGVLDYTGNSHCTRSRRNSHQSALAAGPRTNTVQDLRANHEVLHGAAPRCLGPLVRDADVSVQRTLRSAATN